MCEVTYREGYSVDRCWFHNGYVTEELMKAVREVISNSGRLSDIDIVLICDYLGLNIDSKPDHKAISIKIQRQLQVDVDGWQNHRGTRVERAKEEFIMRMLGWDGYCQLMGIMASGRYAKINVEEVEGSFAKRYYVTERNIKEINLLI